MVKLDTKFKKFLVFNLIFLVLLILVFIFVDLNTPFTIKNIQLNGETTNTEPYNQEIKFVFNRLLSNKLSKEDIKITPEVRFNFSIVSNTLVIKFLDVLNYGEKYKVDIKNITDLFNNELNEKNINFEFSTKDMLLAFIQHDKINQSDSIVLFNKTQNTKETIFTTQNEIQLIDASSKFISFVYNNKQNISNTLCIYNIYTKQLDFIEFINSRITKISLHPNEDKIAYVKQDLEEQIINQNQKIVIPAKNSPYQNLVILDIKTKNSTQYRIFESDASIIDAKYMPNGNAILIKANAQFNPGYYYIFNYKTNEVQPLNQFLSLNSFNKFENKIVGVNYNNLETYSSTTNIQVIDTNLNVETILLDSDVSDPIFANNSDNIILSKNYKLVDTIRGPFEIIKIENNGDIKEILRIENYSMENPKISYDDKILVIEKIPINNILNMFDKENTVRSNRDFIYHIKPGLADLVIFDINKNEIIRTFENSLSPVFIR